MTLATMLTQDVEIITAGLDGDDSHGNEGQNWSEPPSTVVTVKGRLEETDSTEITVGRDTVVSRWRLFLFPNAPLTSDNRVRIDDDTFEVAGRPAVMRSPRGPHHLEVMLVEVEG